MIKNFSWKKIYPHVIAIAVFLVVALIYGRQALSGEVLQQSDMLHAEGMAQDAHNYQAIHGHVPLWNTHLFSGMPNYQITGVGGHSILPNFINIFTLWLPDPISFFFLASICFYILSQALRMRPVIGVLSSLAFAYATFNPIIIVAGHVTQMWAIAFMPAFIAGVILLYEKKYALGMFTATLFASCEMLSGHPQITYYSFLCIGIMSIFYLVKWIKEKAIKHAVIAFGLTILAIVIAVGNTALSVLPTYQYSKYTIRGGTGINVENGKVTEQKHTGGLDENYAFQYSLGKAETFVLAMPNAFGGWTGNMFDESSDAYANAMQVGQQLNGKIPQQELQMVMQSLVSQYWGGIQPFTSGPNFVGTMIVLLALLGFFVTKSKHRWWILTATVVFIFLAWGSYFSAFNDLMLKYFPFYNKFRAPNMAMVIPELLLPLMAGIALEKLLYETDPQTFIKNNFKKILYVLGGFIVLALLVYLGNDYSLSDSGIRSILQNANGGAALSGLESARKAMFLAGIGRLVLFSVFIIAGLFLYAKKILKPIVIVAAFLVINSIDLFQIDSKYMNDGNYIQPDDLQSQNFSETPADQMILQDKSPHFRVFSLASGDPFTDAYPSYYHRSIGGYHAAKLSVYQDLIAAQLQKNPINLAVLNMLDTKYIITPGQTQQSAPVVQQNPAALGAAWFVKQIVYKPTSVDVLNALTNFNPKDTAFVLQSEQAKIGVQPAFDSTATINLVKYDNDTIQYQTNAKSPQFAVLSEVYYPAGWNAYIDGKKTDYVQTNYVLRGIVVPAGRHTIDFKFEPKIVFTAQAITYTANALFWLSIIVSMVFFWRKKEASERQV